MIQRDLSDPFDRGYWARIDNLPRPGDPDEAKGWDDADAELALEQPKGKRS